MPTPEELRRRLLLLLGLAPEPSPPAAPRNPFEEYLGLLAVPTGAREKPPTPYIYGPEDPRGRQERAFTPLDIPGVQRLIDILQPAGDYRLTDKYPLLRTLGAAFTTPAEEPAVQLQQASPIEKVMMGLPIGAPVGSLLGGVPKLKLIPGLAESVARAGVQKAAPVARRLVTEEAGAIRLGPENERILRNLKPEQKPAQIKAIQESTTLSAEEKAARLKIIEEGPITKPAATEALSPAVKPAQATEGIARAWETGASRPFKFDPNSTTNQGRFRLLPPVKEGGYITRQSGTPGVSYIVETKTNAIQAVRFNKAMMPEAKAAEWWEANAARLGREAPVGTKTKAVSESVEQIAEQPIRPTAAPTGVTAAAAQGFTPPAAAVPPAKPPAKPPVTTGAVPPGEPFAANIRLSKYPEDIRGSIKQWADANPEAVQATRRGIRPDTEVLADAQKLVEDMGGDFAKIQKRWKPGEAWNAEEITAIRGTLRAKTDDVLQAAQVARTDNSAANHAKLVIALQEQARVQGIVHGVTAEAGRALRSFRQEAFDAIKANDNQRLEELLRRVGDRAKLDDVAATIAQLDLNNPTAINEFMRKLGEPKFWDYVMELYINSILSGPKTHIINALSNTVNAMASPVERLTAVGVERILAPLQKRPAERFFGEVSADAFGAVEGIREGVRAGVATMKNGINPSQLSKWEFRRTAFKGKLGRVIRAPGTALEAADAMNYSINYRAALNASIVRQARKEGLTGLALRNRVAELKMSPTEDIITQASRIAEYRLFRQEGQFASAVMQFREKYPPLRFVVPFVRTPVNLLKYGLERSPIGLVDPKLWRNLAAKNPEASDQIARIFLGSSLGGLLAWQIAEGNLDITGAAPKSAAERDRFYREGKLPFAIKIGGIWVQYQRLEPFNQIFAQLAAAIEAIRSEDTTASEKAGLVGFTIGQNLVSQTFFTGLNDLLNMLFEPERYGSQYLSRLLAAAVPFSSALRTAAQIADPTFRRPRTVGETLQAGIPGLSRNVPPVLTAFGEEAPRESPAISPIQITSEHQSAVDAELERLGMEVGFVGTTIRGVKLSREKQQQYQVLAGQITQTELARLISSAYYQGLSDVRKEKSLSRIIDVAREKARATVISAPKRPSTTPTPNKQPTPNPKQPENTEAIRAYEDANRKVQEYLDSLRQSTPVPAGVP